MSDVTRELAERLRAATATGVVPPGSDDPWWEVIARTTIDYLASSAPVDAGPELTPSDARRLPWRVIHPAPDEQVEGVAITWSYSEDAIAYRVNNWDVLRATLVATRAQLDDSLVRNAREQDAHSAERAALVRERDAALARAEDLERECQALALGDDL